MQKCCSSQIDRKEVKIYNNKREVILMNILKKIKKLLCINAIMVAIVFGSVCTNSLGMNGFSITYKKKIKKKKNRGVSNQPKKQKTGNFTQKAIKETKDIAAILTCDATFKISKYNPSAKIRIGNGSPVPNYLEQETKYDIEEIKTSIPKKDEGILNAILLSQIAKPAFKRNIINTMIERMYSNRQKLQTEDVRAFLNCKSENTTNNETPLMLAIQESLKAKEDDDANIYIEIVESLLKAGANIREINDENETALEAVLFAYSRQGNQVIKDKRDTRRNSIIALLVNAILNEQSSLVMNNYTNGEKRLFMQYISNVTSTKIKGALTIILDLLLDHNFPNVNRDIINHPDTNDRTLLHNIVRSTEGSPEHTNNAFRFKVIDSVTMINKIFADFTPNILLPGKLNGNILYWAIRGVEPAIIEAIIQNANPNQLLDALRTPCGGVFGNGLNGTTRHCISELEKAYGGNRKRNKYNTIIKRNDWNNEEQHKNITIVNMDIKVELALQKLITTRNTAIGQTLLEILDETVQDLPQGIKRHTIQAYKQINTTLQAIARTLNRLSVPINLMHTRIGNNIQTWKELHPIGNRNNRRRFRGRGRGRGRGGNRGRRRY